VINGENANFIKCETFKFGCKATLKRQQ